MERRAAVREPTTEPGAAEDSWRWIEAWANHVRKRFNSRAVIRARIGEMEPVELSQVYALEGGGLVLVAPCGHKANGPEHDHAAHGQGGAANERHHPAGGAHDHAAHPHGDMDGCCGDCELWLASAAQVVFEARCASEGALCTGFGYLGLSRTPQVLVARATAPPPPPSHEHGNF
jgi:hypothetical protein